MESPSRGTLAGCVLSSTSNIGPDRNPGGHDPTTLQVSKVKSFGVRVRGVSKLWKASLLILSGVACCGRSSIRVEEDAILSETVVQLSASRNRHFVEKISKTLLEVEDFLLYILQKRCPPEGSTINVQKWSQDLQNKKILPQPHAYYGWRGSFDSKVWFVSLNRLLAKKPRPKKFVGVGYSDHGGFRNTALDGSPSWQEVASSRSPKVLHRIERPRGNPIWSRLLKRPIMV